MPIAQSIKYFKVSIPSGEYAIIKLFNGKHSSQIIGDIVDFECNLLDISKLQHLFRAASFELRKMGATIITTWAVPGSKLRRLLERWLLPKAIIVVLLAYVLSTKRVTICTISAHGTWFSLMPPTIEPVAIFDNLSLRQF